MAITLKSPEQIAKMRQAGRVVGEMLQACADAARPGITTHDLDKLARGVLAKRKAKSNFLGYHGYPAVICTSPNSVLTTNNPARPALASGKPLNSTALKRRRSTPESVSSSSSHSPASSCQVADRTSVMTSSREMVNRREPMFQVKVRRLGCQASEWTRSQIRVINTSGNTIPNV